MDEQSTGSGNAKDIAIAGLVFGLVGFMIGAFLIFTTQCRRGSKGVPSFWSCAVKQLMLLIQMVASSPIGNRDETMFFLDLLSFHTFRPSFQLRIIPGALDLREFCLGEVRL